MANFSYHRAESWRDAANRLSNAQSAPLGGGTDLLVAIDEGITAPTELVDLRGIAGAADIVAGASKV